MDTTNSTRQVALNVIDGLRSRGWDELDFEPNAFGGFDTYTAAGVVRVAVEDNTVSVHRFTESMTLLGTATVGAHMPTVVVAVVAEFLELGA
jgi:hypothetical protein